jgi:hypothetical protein
MMDSPFEASSTYCDQEQLAKQYYHMHCVGRLACLAYHQAQQAN